MAEPLESAAQPTDTSSTLQESALTALPVRFLTTIDAHSWLGQLDSTTVRCHRMPSSPAASADVPDVAEQMRRARSVCSPNLTRVLGRTEYDGSTWVVAEHHDGVDLGHLLRSARLRPSQAAYVLAEVLSGVAALHQVGRMHRRLTWSTVWVDRSGQVRLVDWAMGSMPAPRTGNGDHGEDLRGVADLATDLVHNADRPVVRAERDRHLLRVMSGLDITDAPAAHGRLAAALAHALPDPVTHDDLSGELGELVSRLVKSPGPRQDPSPGDAPGDVPVPAAVSQAGGRGTLAPRPGATGWQQQPAYRRHVVWTAAVTIVVLLVGAAAGYHYLRQPVTDTVSGLLHRQSTTATGDNDSDSTQASQPDDAVPAAERPAKKTAANSTHAIPVLAPHDAGAVTGVELKQLATCHSGAPCPVKEIVHLAPASTSQTVTWTITVFDRCTGKRTTHDGSTMTARPGWHLAYDTTSVPLPSSTSLAMIAVTSAPDKASSPAVLVPPGKPSCG